jgi:hypothetical protein
MAPFWKKRKKEEEEFFAIAEQRGLWFLWDKFLHEHAETRDHVPFFLAGSFSYEVPDMNLLRKAANNVAKEKVGIGMLYDYQGDVFFVNRNSLINAANAPNAQEASKHVGDLLRDLIERQISYEISKMSAREIAPALFGEHQQFIQRLRNCIEPKARSIGCSILDLTIERIETTEEWKLKLFDIVQKN